MLHTTRAIVLRTIKHSDKSTVLHTCTEVFGTRTYLLRNPRKGAGQAALLQPLNRVELVVTESHERELHHVRELRAERPFLNVASEPMRGTVLLFAQELLVRTLREESGDAALFGELHCALDELDTTTDIAGVPLRLLVMMLANLGIRPAERSAGEDHFDMREGVFTTGRPVHEFAMMPEASTLFARLLVDGWKGPAITTLAPIHARRALLDDLLIYLRLHVAGFGELRSPAVLKQVLG